MKTYNVGFVGFGFIGKVHAYGYLNLPLFYDPLPLKARISHVCTSRIETAEKGKEQVGAEVATTDFREITENPDIDIVHICTPNDCHKQELLSAMKHNKHIYCDKPLVATMDEAEAIRAALPDYKGTAQMTLQNRFFPATMRAKQLVDEGFLGQLLEFRACYLHSGSADPNAPLKWKLSGKAGGGVIADLASHAMDLIHYLLGDYDSLFASTEIAYPERPAVADPTTRVKVDAEDCVMMLARMKAGGLGHIEATKLATGTEDELRFELHGSKGALRFNTMNPHHLEAFDAGAAKGPIGGSQGWTQIATGQRYPAPAAGFPSPKNSIGWMRSHMACLANFLQAVADGAPGNPGLEQGIALQHLIDCARRSAETRQWVDV
ncbi:MAG: Gfo/Idh/MocA family oxidoreductase [Candidatus Hydrogenedentes bacterium]|nr:Gfo/Idh/MocA family oxidoreductase [Candidatus Hydrogenedentota bacterium]